MTQEFNYQICTYLGNKKKRLIKAQRSKTLFYKLRGSYVNRIEIKADIKSLEDLDNLIKVLSDSRPCFAEYVKK